MWRRRLLRSFLRNIWAVGMLLGLYYDWTFYDYLFSNTSDTQRPAQALCWDPHVREFHLRSGDTTEPRYKLTGATYNAVSPLFGDHSEGTP